MVIACLPIGSSNTQDEYEEEKIHTDSTTATAGSVCGGGDPHRSLKRGAMSTGVLTSSSSIHSRGASLSKLPLIASARLFEAKEEYLTAVEHYLKVTPDLLYEAEGGGASGGGEGVSEASMNHCVEACESLWMHAANLAVKFLTPENSAQIAELVASRLARLHRYGTAGELLLSIDRFEEAVNVYIVAEEWDKARKVARELEPRLESYVENKYKESLRVKYLYIFEIRTYNKFIDIFQIRNYVAVNFS